MVSLHDNSHDTLPASCLTARGLLMGVDGLGDGGVQKPVVHMLVGVDGPGEGGV